MIPNIFDLAVLFFVLTSTWFAYSRGFILEFLTLIAWVVTLILTFVLTPFVASLFFIAHSTLVASILAAVLIFILTLSATHLITHKTSAIIHATSLGSYDRRIGLVFGFLRGLFICIVLSFAVTRFTPASFVPSWVSNGIFWGFLRNGGLVLGNSLPSGWENRFAGSSDILHQKIDTMIFTKAKNPQDKLAATAQPNTGSTNPDSALVQIGKGKFMPAPRPKDIILQ